jgi:hypothetical protein
MEGAVGSIVVRDAMGVRWKVRARQLRRGESSRPWSGPEEDSLRRRLVGVLAPHPLVVLDPLRGVPGGWRTPGDSADVALRETRAEFGDHRDVGSSWWAVAQLFRMVRDALDHLSTPWSDTWRLEAVACGRIRRWAIWEIDGAEATEPAVAAVAAALGAGVVPQPTGAVLVEVVDQRPPLRSRRSAGLGRHTPVG